METLALPSEMVAESVVNNIQTGGGRDNSAGDDELILQLVIALSVGEYSELLAEIEFRIIINGRENNRNKNMLTFEIVERKIKNLSNTILDHT